jgi:hypothetical protein
MTPTACLALHITVRFFKNFLTVPGTGGSG